MRVFILLAVGLLLSACGAPAADVTPMPATATPTPLPAETPTNSPTATETATDEPDAGPPGASVQTVTLSGAGALQLAATLFLPAERPAPGVLLLHMFGRQRSDWDPLAGRLQESGYAVLTIDLRGHGETEGALDWTLAQEDVLHAYQWLAGHEAIQAERTAVIGASIGANLALVLGAAAPEIDALIALSPGLDYFGVRTQPSVETAAGRPMLLVAAENDTFAADSVRNLTPLAGESAEQVLFSGGSHGTQLLEAEPELVDRLLQFLRTHLGE